MHNDLKLMTTIYHALPKFCIAFYGTGRFVQEFGNCFISANNSPLVVLMCFSEDGETAMNYWLHMLMFKYCHARYPNVVRDARWRLTLGLVLPKI
jgi:adenosine deaminase/adenosine deaminase CECR1